MDEKVLFSTREIVADKLLKQLEASSQEKRKQLMMKLLERVDPTFVIALDFAYDMAPKQTEKSKE